MTRRMMSMSPSDMIYLPLHFQAFGKRDRGALFICRVPEAERRGNSGTLATPGVAVPNLRGLKKCSNLQGDDLYKIAHPPSLIPGGTKPYARAVLEPQPIRAEAYVRSCT